MLALGLSAADYKQYMETLASSHEIKVTVQILRPTHAVASTISHMLIDGQVDCEAVEGDKSDIANSRTAILRFLDPNRTLGFEAGSPNDGAVFFDRMLRVIYSVYTGRAANGGWVDVPVMTGPIMNFEREGNEVVVEARGKEEYGLGQIFKTAKYAKGTYKVAVIRSLLAISGEINSYMQAIPSTGGERTPVAISMTGEQKVWPEAFKQAKGMLRNGKNVRLFYNALGQAVLRPIGQAPVFTMAAKPGGLLTSEPKIAYSMTDLKNVVKVIGRKTASSSTGTPPVVSYAAVAPATHPLSPNKLGRNDNPRYYLYVLDNPNVIGRAAAKTLAKSQLKYWLNQQVQATWECLPVPHMEPWDTVNLVTSRGILTAPCRRFTLPLVAGPSMSVGSTRAVRRPRR